MPPSVDRFTCSEGRLVFVASFLLAPNVAPPLEPREPLWSALSGAMRTDVNGLSAFCCRLALVYSRSRKRSKQVGSATKLCFGTYPLTVPLTTVIAVCVWAFIRLLV